MKNKLFLTIIAISSAITLFGCQSKEATTDIKPATNVEEIIEDDAPEEEILEEMSSESTDEEDTIPTDLDKSMLDAYSNFGWNVFTYTIERSSDENVLISPISITLALNMAMDGAEGNTLSELTSLYGNEITRDELDSFAAGYLARLNEDEITATANSTWINEAMAENINDSYLERLNKLYGASATALPFDDEAPTIINSWVNENTHGMIPTILDNINNEAALLLINATVFEGKWEETYDDSDIIENYTFVNNLGEEVSCKMLCSTEKDYIESEDARGFVKFYDGDKYAFMAILPNDENISIKDFVTAQEDNYISNMFKARKPIEVYTRLPAFEADYTTLLNEVLTDMGLKDSFNPVNADFSGIGKSKDSAINFYLDRILHKTHITLDENGTRAAAVTALEMNATALMADTPSPIELDRPFIYAIMDVENEIPIFIGEVSSPQ